MSVEQWLGGGMAFAFLLAVLNLLVGSVGIRAHVARLRPRRGRELDRIRDASRGSTRHEREQLGEPRALRRLRHDERDRYVERWTQLQHHADALPATTLLDADVLLDDLLDDLGYPTEGFVQYAADLSPAHAGAVDDYRAARTTVLNTRLGLADTDEIRQAMLCYVTVFECLAQIQVSGKPKQAVG